MIPETVELMNAFKAKYQNAEEQCNKCKYYIENYKMPRDVEKTLDNFMSDSDIDSIILCTLVSIST